MNNKLGFAVIGGDRRNFFAAKRLKSLGFETQLFALSGEKHFSPGESITADVVLLPIPLSRDGVHLFAPESDSEILLSDVLRAIPGHALIFGGNTACVSDERMTDYAKKEDFALLNAVPTAQGALLLALQTCGRTVFGMRVAVIGYGRVACAVAKFSHALGAEVTVFARKSQARTQAHIMGYTAMPIEALPDTAGSYDLLINTVPARILHRSILKRISKSTYILDLASAPFGLDFEEARTLGIRAECASGLPGKFFPETAGEAVADTVLSILREKQILHE